jgi:hypothetical protein
MPVEVETADDIFLPDLPDLQCATFFPLGFPVELATNSEAVMHAARQSWAMFPAAHLESPISLCLTVAGHEDQLPQPPKFRTHGHLMSIVADARNHAICDFSRQCAFAWVTQRVAEQSDFLRFHFLEGPVMTLLVAAHFAPIHGALVMRNGVGVALCGDSLAGKSTLAYACARSGWTFVSDDAAFLLRRQPGRFAVGNSSSARFREHAKLLFPELENCRFRPKLNGAPGMEVPTSDLPVETASGCSIDHLVFLRRAPAGRARIGPFDKARALAWLEQVVLYGPADVRESLRQAYRRLLSAGTWELHYSNLSDAVHLLERLEF